MKERIVQWVLLREWEYLQSCLKFPLLRHYGENIATDHGTLDFVLLTTDPNHPLLIVELETEINTKQKMIFVEDQLRRYRSVTFHGYPSTLILLYAEDVTSPKRRTEIQEICRQLNVEPRTYSLQEVQSRYQRIISELEKNAGLQVGPTAAMDVCYLRWMNRLIKPFVEQKKNVLPVSIFFSTDGSGIFKKRTNYGVLKKLCQDFELIRKSKTVLELTMYGKRFANAMVPDVLVGYSQIPPLSPDQKRILLEVLTNGFMTPCKANIYYFLRFMHITEGAWVPKSTAKEPQPGEKAFDYWHLAEGLIGKRYSWRTITDFLAFSCNQCEELGLVDRVKLQGDHDRAVLTSLGSRVLGLLELDLHLKRERVQIPLGEIS